jgi:hypothetical protein
MAARRNAHGRLADAGERELRGGSVRSACPTAASPTRDEYILKVCDGTPATSRQARGWSITLPLRPTAHAGEPRPSRSGAKGLGARQGLCDNGAR